MTDNLEAKLVRVLVVATILVVGLFALNACGDNGTIIGQPFPCDVCSRVVAPDAGSDAQ